MAMREDSNFFDIIFKGMFSLLGVKHIFPIAFDEILCFITNVLSFNFSNYLG